MSVSREAAATELLKRRRAREGLIDFTLYTKNDFQVARHHYLIASYLEAVERGEIDRLMIFTPPRHTKSELASRRFPAWFLGRNPDKQIIATSYNSDLATDFGRDVRNIVADSSYSRVFQTILRPDSKAADRWKTNKGGVYVSAGIGAGITGKGAHLGLIDDPDKDRKEADSKTFREAKWKWYTSTFYTRLMPGGRIILISTRWHDDDLAGRLLKAQEKGGDKWVVVKLPAIATENDPMGRKPGEALWPEWYNLEALARIKAAIGSAEFEPLYQQNPSAAQGNIFKREWWQYYREAPVFEKVVQSWDTAFKKDEQNDFNACVTCGVGKTGYYFKDVFKKRLEYPELKQTVINLAARDTPHAILIEDKASGQSLIQDLKRNTRLPIIAWKADKDKVARANAVTPLIEAGKVFLLSGAPWVQDYVDSLADFPNGAHDDDVDATTQLLNYVMFKPGAAKIEELLW